MLIFGEAWFEKFETFVFILLLFQVTCPLDAGSNTQSANIL